MYIKNLKTGKTITIKFRNPFKKKETAKSAYLKQVKQYADAYSAYDKQRNAR